MANQGFLLILLVLGVFGWVVPQSSLFKGPNGRFLIFPEVYSMA